MISWLLDVESSLTRHGNGSSVLGESTKRGIDLIYLSDDRALSYQRRLNPVVGPNNLVENLI